MTYKINQTPYLGITTEAHFYILAIFIQQLLNYNVYQFC